MSPELEEIKRMWDKVSGLKSMTEDEKVEFAEEIIANEKIVKILCDVYPDTAEGIQEIIESECSELEHKGLEEQRELEKRGIVLLSSRRKK